jgi:hypothetical protein
MLGPHPRPKLRMMPAARAVMLGAVMPAGQVMAADQTPGQLIQVLKSTLGKPSCAQTSPRYTLRAFKESLGATCCHQGPKAP